MICPQCASLHFDGAYQRCEDCRVLAEVEKALKTSGFYVHASRPINFIGHFSVIQQHTINRGGKS